MSDSRSPLLPADASAASVTGAVSALPAGAATPAGVALSRFRVSLLRLEYHGRRADLPGGWHYTKRLLGVIHCEAPDACEAERRARRVHPEANWAQVYEWGEHGTSGRFELVMSGAL